MRAKQDILRVVHENIKKAAKEARGMLEHEYCYVEIWMDIRDIMSDILREMKNIKEVVSKKGGD